MTVSSLRDLLSREKRLSPERAIELMATICAGVGAAHRQGIVHHDLKPSNIVIRKDRCSMSEAVKIRDFGLAKIKSGEFLAFDTVYYVAPEKWAGENPGAAADIYSLGVMLFQMIAGEVPFGGSSAKRILKKHIKEPPPTFAELGVEISSTLERVVQHALEKDPQKRTPSTEAFVEEMRNAIMNNSQSTDDQSR